MSDWNFLNKHRTCSAGLPPTDPSWGFNGLFMFNLPGQLYTIRCVASDGAGWQHVSVSFWLKPHKVPSWELMCQIKALFWEPQDAVIQIHPPESEYVNEHPGCLHLWRCTCATQPLPPTFMVGTRGRTYEDVQKMTPAELIEAWRRQMQEAGEIE